jgi:transcription elongation GreA/GreB family factor
VAELEAALLPLTDEAEVKKVRRALRYWSTVRRPRNWRRFRGEVVEFGSTVTFALRGKAKTITIVGDDEADPADGLVSFSAPLSRAMMGAEEGDFADFGGEADAIEIQEIRVPAA